jgi:hypothetical protein
MNSKKNHFKTLLLLIFTIAFTTCSRGQNDEKFPIELPSKLVEIEFNKELNAYQLSARLSCFCEGNSILIDSKLQKIKIFNHCDEFNEEWSSNLITYDYTEIVSLDSEFKFILKEGNSFIFKANKTSTGIIYSVKLPNTKNEILMIELKNLQKIKVAECEDFDG